MGSLIMTAKTCESFWPTEPASSVAFALSMSFCGPPLETVCCAKYTHPESARTLAAVYTRRLGSGSRSSSTTGIFFLLTHRTSYARPVTAFRDGRLLILELVRAFDMIANGVSSCREANVEDGAVTAGLRWDSKHFIRCHKYAVCIGDNDRKLIRSTYQIKKFFYRVINEIKHGV